MLAFLKYNPDMALDKAIKIYAGCYVALAGTISVSGGLMLFTDPHELHSKVLLAFFIGVSTYLLFMDTGHRKSLFKHAAAKRSKAGFLLRILLFKPTIQTATYFLSVLLPLAVCFTILANRVTMLPIQPLEFVLTVLALSAAFSCVVFVVCFLSLLADSLFKKLGEKMRQRVDGF